MQGFAMWEVEVEEKPHKTCSMQSHSGRLVLRSPKLQTVRQTCCPIPELSMLSGFFYFYVQLFLPGLFLH